MPATTETRYPAMTPEAEATAVGESFEVEGYTLRRLAENEFAAFDPENALDFHIILLAEPPEGLGHLVEVDIYDNHVLDRREAFVDTAYGPDLREAVINAFFHIDVAMHRGCDRSVSFEGDRAAEDR